MILILSVILPLVQIRCDYRSGYKSSSSGCRTLLMSLPGKERNNTTMYMIRARDNPFQKIISSLMSVIIFFKKSQPPLGTKCKTTLDRI